MFFEGSPHLVGVDYVVYGIDPADVVHVERDLSDGERAAEAFARIATLRPGAAWYIKADDDAYLHIPNYITALLQLNASRALLAGFTDVDPVGAGGGWAWGGASYALSGPALSIVNHHIAAWTAAHPLLKRMEDISVAGTLNEQLRLQPDGDSPQQRPHVVHLNGTSWTSPAQLISEGHLRDPRYALAAPPLSFHYMRSSMIAELLQPQVPRRIHMVLPYSFHPSMEALQQFGAIRDTCIERFRAHRGDPLNTWHFSHYAVDDNAAVGENIAVHYITHLQAMARAIILGLGTLYSKGGALMTPWTKCSVWAGERGMLDALHQYSDPRNAFVLGSPFMWQPICVVTHDHTTTRPASVGWPCDLVMAPPANQNIFRLLAGYLIHVVQSNVSFYTESAANLLSQDVDASLSFRIQGHKLFVEVAEIYHVNMRFIRVDRNGAVVPVEVASILP